MTPYRKRSLLALTLAALMTLCLLAQAAEAMSGSRVYCTCFGGDVKSADTCTRLGIVLFPGDQIRDLSNTAVRTVDGKVFRDYYLGFDPDCIASDLCSWTQRSQAVSTGSGQSQTFVGISELTITGSKPVVVEEDFLRKTGPYQICVNGLMTERNTVYHMRIHMQALEPYRLCYDLDGGCWAGGTNPNPTTLAQSPADRSVGLTHPVRPGFTFCGWRLDSSSTALMLRGEDELVVPGLSSGDPDADARLLEQCRRALRDGCTLTAIWQEDGGKATPSVLPENLFQPAPMLFRTWSKGEQRFRLGIKARGGARLSYRSGSPGKVSVTKSGQVRIGKGFLGRVQLKVTAAATSQYRRTTRTMTLMVGPSPTQLGLVAGSKGILRVKWKKNTTGKGYELQISRKKSFIKPIKTLKLKKASTVTAAVKGLKKGTCYVRLRTINGKTFSQWSRVKKGTVG